MTSRCDYIPANQCNSLSELFLQRVQRSPQAEAYRFHHKLSGTWRSIQWAEVLAMVTSCRLALLRENLTKGDRLALMLGNSPEWVVFEQAALSLGLIVVPLYANDRPENIGYILETTNSRVLLCPGITYYSYLAPVLQRLPDLQRIITADNCQISDDKRLACLPDWLTPAAQVPATPFIPEPHPTASIVFTSGTTGPPKGVMLSHRNILDNCYAGLQTMEIFPDDTFLSFLPLSHMLERTAGYYMPMTAGATVAFARSVPDLPEDLLTVKPTVLVAVPRIFERVYSSIMTTLKTKSNFARGLFRLGVDVGWRSFLRHQGRGNWGISLLLQPLLDKLVGGKVRDRLGGRLRIIISGGAPLATEIAQFFIGLGLPIFQGYGLTETSPVISVNRQENNRPDTVGQPLPGLEIQVDERGELLVRGNCVMQGYWRNESATRATISPDGWLHTGDKAEIIDGFIRITGRLKEIIVLSNGEKVAPADLEMAIAMDPLFEHNMVLGEGKPYLSLLTVLNQPLWEELAAELGVAPDEASLELPEVREVLLKRLEGLLVTFPGYVFIKDVGLSLTPWTVENGLLTPTLKLKRAAVQKHLAGLVERMYAR